MAGGRSGVLTTTRLIEDQRLGDRGGEIFDLGGPFGNLLFAAAPWIAQRLLRRPAPRLRLWLWLLMVYSVFWAFGYLIFCGVFGRGDWFALIRGLPYQWLWRSMFVVIGILLYRGCVTVSASELRWIVHPADGDSQFRVRRLGVVCYIAGGLIACAGAAFDPRGAAEIWNSGALTSFGAAVGLLLVPGRFLSFRQELAAWHRGISRSTVWIVLAALISIFYIGILGPGLIRLGTSAQIQRE